MISGRNKRHFEAGASRRRISILHRNERFPVYGIYFDWTGIRYTILQF